VFLRENEIGRRVAPHLRPGEPILDYGAGTGRISGWLAEQTGVRPTLTDLIPYSNRRRDLPFVRMDDPFHVPLADRTFDTVLLLFVLHHNRYEEQGKVVTDAVRLARRRVIVLEDTPTGRIDLVCNMLWDRILNLRHATPTPFAFRSVAEWTDVFMEHDLSIVHCETYRAKWPTLGMYHHSLFVLDVEPAAGPGPD
jgi:SAM-dependent methyltransferase